MVNLIPGFTAKTFQYTHPKDGEITIAYQMAGNGPPLLLLHGFPQTKIIWHAIAPELAKNFTVIASDLRGYGESSKPSSTDDHDSYSKRSMAGDQVALMASLGFAQFALVGHDRGGRVAHRLAMDHPQAVSKLMVLDICPTLSMYEQTSMVFAKGYYHWFFLIQPHPIPEKMIGADVRFFMNQYMGNRYAGQDVFLDACWDEYIHAMENPACLHAMCEDYRAAAGIDLIRDQADRESGKKLTMPLRVLWGAKGLVNACFDPLFDWGKVALDVSGKALDCGHYIPEESPAELLHEIRTFFTTEGKSNDSVI